MLGLLKRKIARVVNRDAEQLLGMQGISYTQHRCQVVHRSRREQRTGESTGHGLTSAVLDAWLSAALRQTAFSFIKLHHFDAYQAVADVGLWTSLGTRATASF